MYRKKADKCLLTEKNGPRMNEHVFLVAAARRFQRAAVNRLPDSCVLPQPATVARTPLNESPPGLGRQAGCTKSVHSTCCFRCSKAMSLCVNSELYDGWTTIRWMANTRFSLVVSPLASCSATTTKNSDADLLLGRVVCMSTGSKQERYDHVLVDAVRRRDDPTVADQGAAAEMRTAQLQRYHPGKLAGKGIDAVDDPTQLVAQHFLSAAVDVGH